MKIIILSSCTGEKRFNPEKQLTKSDFELIHTPLFADRIASLSKYQTSAEDLYTGQQHKRLISGINFLRETKLTDGIDLRILSAGYGLIKGSSQIAPYECTFQGMKQGELRKWSEHLQIPAKARALFSEPADFVLVLLGDSYLQALQLDDEVTFTAPTLFLTSSGAVRSVKGQGCIRSLPLTNSEAKRFACGLVGLKGELAKRLLYWIGKQDSNAVYSLFDPSFDILSLLETNRIPSPTPLKKKAAIANPFVDHVIQIPNSWWQKDHRHKLRYFIPDCDDMVDPDYDFVNDSHSGEIGDWTNQVYAHQLYSEPNSDGILVSKVVVENGAKKRERINQLGVHRYLRVPEQFPIMGDCGAFGYAAKEVPPFTTSEILDYYTRLGFDYGVSIDHLIFTNVEEIRQFRYQLTMHNAEEFLHEHRKMGLSWEPIGAVQGWDPQSYADAAKQYVSMGYKYIGLGGLVRTNTQKILRILSAVHDVVPRDVSIHLFGLARLDAVSEFVKFGVRSIDSSAPLRRAWLGSNDNYWTENGEIYAAIRIPESGKSFRAKRMVSEERVKAEEAVKLERACFDAMMKYDQGLISVNETLDILDEYDHLITPNRKSTRVLSQRTLEEQPWKTCSCDICKKDGIQTIIFRGNNRNRRRGFHNVYSFYRLMQKILAGEQVKYKGKMVDQKIYQLGLF